MTKRILVLVVACVIVQAAAWGAPCVVGTVASYLALGAGGCTIGDKLFNDFSFTASQGGGAVAPGAAGITVTPVLGTEIGLQFNSLWAAGSGAFVDTTIDFDVAVIGGGAMLIDDASTVQSSGGFTGTGAATVSEGLCGPTPCSITTMNTFTINTAGTTKLSDHIVFTSRGSVHAVKDIGVSGGVSGSGTLSQVVDTFSQVVPEPTSILLLGSVTIVLGRLFRRCRAREV
jgi:hypothetical protein